MKPEQAAKLREPFADSSIGKLPRITCGRCRNSNTKVCDTHSKRECPVCGNWMTTAHMHLDYVGHADVTDRLLAVDPEWDWEPVSVDANGLPLLDAAGGLWIRLTVCGMARLGYGHPDGKKGGDAVKEVIGDALRNAAMRFGIALDLWKKELPQREERPEPPAQQAPPEEQSQEPSEADQIRTQIQNICTAKQYDTAAVAADFAQRIHKDIRTASVAELSEYREWLRTNGLPS